jgi:two-component system, cell cycle response regulator DivK
MARGTVLVVDDHPLNLKLTRLLLEQAGYGVQTAANADETMAVIAQQVPQLILMDLQLPGVDGFELTTRLKADPATRGVPIVALTAYAMKGDEARARASGCDGYIAKPISTRRLMAELAPFLEPRG